MTADNEDPRLRLKAGNQKAVECHTNVSESAVECQYLAVWPSAYAANDLLSFSSPDPARLGGDRGAPTAMTAAAGPALPLCEFNRAGARAFVRDGKLLRNRLDTALGYLSGRGDPITVALGAMKDA